MPTPVKRGRQSLGTEAETAAILGVRPITLKMARYNGTGDFATLRWFKVGSLVRYDLDYIFDVWLPARQRGGARVASVA